jgi:hypothetical protein
VQDEAKLTISYPFGAVSGIGPELVCNMHVNARFQSHGRVSGATENELGKILGLVVTPVTYFITTG